jgi:hypothetical protein
MRARSRQRAPTKGNATVVTASRPTSGGTVAERLALTLTLTLTLTLALTLTETRTEALALTLAVALERAAQLRHVGARGQRRGRRGARGAVCVVRDREVVRVAVVALVQLRGDAVRVWRQQEVVRAGVRWQRKRKGMRKRMRKRKRCVGRRQVRGR